MSAILSIASFVLSSISGSGLSSGDVSVSPVLLPADEVPDGFTVPLLVYSPNTFLAISSNCGNPISNNIFLKPVEVLF